MGELKRRRKGFPTVGTPWAGGTPQFPRQHCPGNTDPPPLQLLATACSKKEVAGSDRVLLGFRALGHCQKSAELGDKPAFTRQTLLYLPIAVSFRSQRGRTLSSTVGGLQNTQKADGEELAASAGPAGSDERVSHYQRG